VADQDFISGALAGQQYQLNRFLLQEAPVKLESEKLALDVAKVDQARRQKMADLLAQHPPPAGQDPLEKAQNTLFGMADAAVQAGLPEEATSNLKAASTIANERVDAAYKNSQMIMQQTKYADELLATIPEGVSQEEGQRQLNAIDAHIQMYTGKPSWLSGKKYDAKLIDDLRRATMEKRTKAQEDLSKAEAERNRAAAAAERALVPLRKAQAELAEKRKDAAGKLGSASGLVAKPATITAAANYIRTQKPDLDDFAARTYADDMALRTEYLMAHTNGLTRPQAIAQAYQESTRHGKLAGLPQAHAMPGSVQKPYSLPADPHDPKSYKDQMVYNTPDGPRWYDAGTQKLYKVGSGPEEDEAAEDAE
jgi:hypothetical protein